MGDKEKGFGLCGEEELTRNESLKSDDSSVNQFARRPSWTGSFITPLRSTSLASRRGGVEKRVAPAADFRFLEVLSDIFGKSERQRGIMVLSIQTKRSRNFRCISLQ